MTYLHPNKLAEMELFSFTQTEFPVFEVRSVSVDVGLLLERASEFNSGQPYQGSS